MIRTLICCNGSRTHNTKYEQIMQCGGCNQLWHTGCWETLLKDKNYICCEGSPMNFTKFKSGTALASSPLRGEHWCGITKLPPPYYKAEPFPSEKEEPSKIVSTVLLAIAGLVLFFGSAAILGSAIG